MSTTFSNVSVESNRKIIKLTDKTHAITIPPDWIRTSESILLRKLEDVNLVMNGVNGVLIVTPRENTGEYKNLLIAWEFLNKKQKQMLLEEAKHIMESK